jgi:cytochrome c oxidase subunit 2
VPELGRKIDLVPGHPNYIWLVAGKPGVYLGACAEFCGDQHANMRIRVVAEPEAEFKKWLDGQLAIPRTPTGGIAADGARLFQTMACMNCQIRGRLRQQGRADLTHRRPRTRRGCSRIRRRTAKWLANPRGINRAMPNSFDSEVNPYRIPGGADEQ